MLWVLSFSDGTHSLLDIAERAGLPFEVVAEAARTLESVALLVERNHPESASDPPRRPG
jgi:aminopeptidase-like protein